MNFELLWLEIVLMSLLWVAAASAWVGRVRFAWVRTGLWVLIVLYPLFYLVMFAALASAAKFVGKLEQNWFYYATSLLVVFVMGTGVILVRARRKIEGETRPAATRWPRVMLTLAWVFAVAMALLTLSNMDLALQTRWSFLATRAHEQYLAAMPPVVAPEQNAAPIYEQAFALLKQDSKEGINNPPFGQNETFDPNEPATVAYLQRQEPTISLLRQAAAMPSCRFDADIREIRFEDWWQMSGLSVGRAAANLLGLHARQAIAVGHVDEAMADVKAIYGMSRHLGWRPSLVAGLVGIGIDALSNETLVLVLPSVTKESELASLPLDRLPPLGPMFRQALLADMRFGLLAYRSGTDGFDAIKKESSLNLNKSMMWPSGNSGAAFVRVFYLNEVDAYVAHMQKMQDWAVQPYYQVRGQFPSDETIRSQGFLLSILVPSLNHALEASARAQAGEDCGRIAVAMTRYRLDHGKLPEKLEDLIPQYLKTIPVDPFDGKPLRLAEKEDRCVIYSVGPDQVDDGGVDLDIRHKSSSPVTKGDVILTLWRTK